MSAAGTARRLALAVVVNLGLLSLAEGGLTLLGWPDPGLYSGDPGFYWTLRPDLELASVPHVETGGRFSVRTNARGLRDAPLPESGPWILAMGCSTTFGWGVEAEETWVERLESALGIPVVNAGVPGHSTAQGLRFAPDLLAARPTIALFGWLVRDAQIAGRADIDARPSPWLTRTHLFRGLKSLLPTPARHADGSEGPGEGTPRVSARQYKENLEALLAIAEAQEVRPVLLAFPTVEPLPEHRAALGSLDASVLSPAVPASGFFPEDPIHLTAEGNAALAAALEAPLRSLLSDAAGGGGRAPDRP